MPSTPAAARPATPTAMARRRYRTGLRRPPQRHADPALRRGLHQRHGQHDHIARRRLHRRGMANRDGWRALTRSTSSTAGRDGPGDRHLDQRQRSELRYPRHRDRGREERQRGGGSDRTELDDHRPQHRQRATCLDPMDRYRRDRRRRRPRGRRLLGHAEPRRSEPVDQRRLAERGQRRHDDLHLHGGPVGSPAPAGGVTFDIATADGPGGHEPSDYARQVADRPDDPGGQLDLHVRRDRRTATRRSSPDETFFVNVTNVTGATVTDGRARARS